ncbi:hypothetical protein M7775_05660 [Sporomusa sphaeroides DSM 2875]|uniref:hypothetical protein n=1 Tax=Sporomusa sphaeroides TaxID=47679 RepID=UPI00202EE183|nr:hypothetical protein [Sporomusa sphaeroides]MCM0758062.1 hypothetical protein [Sporomusa sphaeroides DSM 2875]
MVRNVIDLAEVREEIQYIREWGDKVEAYFTNRIPTAAESELINDLLSDGYATRELAVMMLEMIVDGDVTAGYKDGKLTFFRTQYRSELCKGGENMYKKLTEEVKTLAILVAKEMQKDPAMVTPEMLIALRGCAQILENKTAPED